MPEISENPIGEAYLIRTGNKGYMIRLMGRQHEDHSIVGCAVVAPWIPPVRFFSSNGRNNGEWGGEGMTFPPSEAHFDYEDLAVARHHLQLLYALPNLPQLSEKEAFLAAARETYHAAQIRFLMEKQKVALMHHKAASLPQLLEIVDPNSEEGRELARIRDRLEGLLRK